MKTLKRLAAVLLILIAIPASVTAQHASSYSLKYVDGSNLILVTYSAHQLESGLPTKHNIRLYDLDGHPISFQEVKIELLRGDNRVRAETIPVSDNNDVTFDYTYPAADRYTLKVSFLDNDKEISHGEFLMQVAKGANQSFFADAFTLKTALALILGAGVASVYLMRGKLELQRRFNKIVKAPSKK